LALDVALRLQRETPILQSSLPENTIMLDMSAIRFCVVRITAMTVSGQCNHELSSLVCIVAILNLHV
jgi:hypothetical protein